MTVSCATSITAIALSLPSVTYAVLPSGLSAIPRGRLPTGNVLVTVLVARSMTEMLFPPSLLAYTRPAGGALVAASVTAAPSAHHVPLGIKLRSALRGSRQE